ncbi:MAG: hypothetical protein ACOYJB_05395 [Christensenellaceae bacterium]
MKKIIATIAVGIMLFAAVGCGAQPQTEQSAGPEAAATQSPVSSELTDNPQGEETPAAAQDEAGDAQDVNVEEMGVSLFGKVKSIVGNEIELELAEPPFDMGEAGGDGAVGGSFAISPSMQFEAHSDDSRASVSTGEEPADADTTSGTVVAIAGEDGQIQVIGGDGENKMELEYTGESKSVIIPAGTEILNLLGGEGTLDNIKKGSVLMVGVEDENADTLKAKNVFIME